jgi:hypothetical protein
VLDASEFLFASLFEDFVWRERQNLISITIAAHTFAVGHAEAPCFGFP